MPAAWLILLPLAVALPDPLSAFAAAGHSWPSLPCRSYVGERPARTDGKRIFTPTESALSVWTDRSCSKNLPAAEVRLPHTPNRQEQIQGIALIPPNLVVVASFWGFGEGLDATIDLNGWSMLRFYHTGLIGSSSAPLLRPRRLAGKITAVLATGEVGANLYVGVTDFLTDQNFIYCFVNIKHFPEREAMLLEVPEMTAKLVFFEDYIIAASFRSIYILRRDLEMAFVDVAPSWTVGNSTLLSDLCVVEQFLVVAANDLRGQGRRGYLHVFDLPKALQGGWESSKVAQKGFEAEIQCLALVDGLGFVAASWSRVVFLFRNLDITTLKVYSNASIGSSLPFKMHFMHGSFLAVGAVQGVEILSQRMLFRRAPRKLFSVVLPVESRVVDLLQLPGNGFAVATFHQVHFFGESATYLSRASELDSVETVGGVSLVAPLSGGRILVSAEDGILSVHSMGGALATEVRLERYLELDGAAISSCEIVEQGLLALGLRPNSIFLFNMSIFESKVKDKAPLYQLQTDWPVHSMASAGEVLLAGDEKFISVISLNATPRRVFLRKQVSVCWDIVRVGELWAAAFDQEVLLYSWDSGAIFLRVAKHLKVEGSAFALHMVGDLLLVATSGYLEVFEAEALDPEKSLDESRARLQVNGLVPARREQLIPENSVGVVEDKGGLLVGLDLYRPGTAAGVCSYGHFSPPGNFTCHPCPSGWTSYRAAGSCDFAKGETIFQMIRIYFVVLLICAFLIPKAVSALGIPQVAIYKTLERRIDPRPYALILATLLWLGLSQRSKYLQAVLPLASSFWAAAPSVPGWGTCALRCLAGSSLASMWCCLLMSHTELSQPLPSALALITSCNLYLTLQLRCWLRNSFVNTPDGIRANTAGVRTVSLLVGAAYSFVMAFAILCLLQDEEHSVWTPFGLARIPNRVPSCLMALSVCLAVSSIGMADQACTEAEELHEASGWASDEKVPPARLPRGLRFKVFLRLTVLCKSWRSRHMISLTSALYDSYTFYQGLQRSRTGLTSQFYDFALILLLALFTASINAIALMLDHLHVRAQEIGDRTFRLSTFCKCGLLLMKLRVLKVPLVVNQRMDASWLSHVSDYPKDNSRIPIWMCQATNLCPFRCRDQLGGNCTYTEQPAYGGCYCEYWSTGIPVASDRIMVFVNCVVSGMVIALLTNSKMRTRGLFRNPELSLFSLGCCTFLPTAFIAINTIYLSVPQFAKLHVDFPNDFLTLTIPALIFVLMANEMARRIETAWKLRFLGPSERVTLCRMDGHWQVVLSHGLDHMLGTRVDAVDEKGRSLLSSEQSELTVQGPAVLLSKDPPRYGSLWVSSGFRALTPLAHLCTVLAILKVWERLKMKVILVDVIVLLILSVASGILSFTLTDGEWQEVRRLSLLPESASSLEMRSC